MTVQEYMFVSGIAMNLTGYEYLKDAIEISIEDSARPIMMIYEDVAKKHNANAYTVERNCRTAIKKGYPKMDADIKKKLFRSTEKVATGEYVKGIAYAIRNNLI